MSLFTKKNGMGHVLVLIWYIIIINIEEKKTDRNYLSNYFRIKHLYVTNNLFNYGNFTSFYYVPMLALH